MSKDKFEHQAVTPQRIQWTPELVARFWNGFSQTKLVEFSFSKQAGRSLILCIDHLLPRDGRILDFGAGDGYLIKLMCERGLHVAAYEPSEGRAKNLKVLLQDYHGFLGIEDDESTQAFDVVIMAEVIEHILDGQLDDTLRRLNQLTRPDGVLVVTTPNNEDLDLGMAYCPVSNILFHRWQHVRSFTEISLAKLLADHGFDEIVTHKVEFDDALYVPSDPIWGGAQNNVELPSHIQELRANCPAQIGSETNLLYIGRRRYRRIERLRAVARFLLPMK